MEAFDDDDDFGELYADVELPPLAPTTDLFIQQQQQQQQQRQQPPNSNGNGDGGCVALSDSDDDDGLNIVLNDDEGVCNGLPPVARSDDVDDDCGGEGGGDGGGGERLEDRSEFLSKNGVRGGYGSLFFRRKYTRNQGLISLGIGSSLSKSWRNGDTCLQNLPSSSSHVTRICATPNPKGVQYGYGSVLPWYWSIFDVNIEMFPEKSWRVPGADITDYFNFGFNENTWKLYCASLEQLSQTTMGTGISGDESLKLTQEAMSQQIDEVVSGSALSPSSEFELPKGRAIQVEDNMIERKPSMDVKRPRNQDSDVIIQIKVHESSDDCSRSGNSTVMDASLEGEPALVDNKILTSGELDVSEDQLEAVKKSVQERTGLIPEVDEHELQDEVDKHSNDAAQVPGGEMKSEQGIAIDTYSADPCWIESELSLGDQELSLTSYTDSDSEATENSVHVDNEKSHIPLRRQSVNSDISLKNSLPVHRKNSKGNNLDRRPPNVTYYSRNKRPFQKECRRQNGRQWRGSSLNYPIEYDNDSSSIPSYSARDLSLFGNQFIDYDICKERAPGFASRKRRYDRETKQSFYYGREKVNNNLLQTLHTKYSYRDDREIFREKTNQYDRKYENERDYFFESRSPMADDEGRERKWHDADLEYYADDLSPHSCWELRQFPRKHSSFRDEERGAHRRRMNDRFGDRYYSDDLDEYELEFLNTSYRISPYSERNMESLNNRHEESFSDIDIDPRRSARRDRHCDRPLDLDNLWPGKREDYSQKYKHHQISKKRRECRQSYATSMRNYAYGTRVTEKLEVSRRYEHARNNRGSYGYTDAVEDEDFMIDPAEEYQCYRSPSEVLNWIEDENTFKHHEIHTTSLHAKVQLGGIEFQQHQLNMPRSSENCLNGRSKIMDRGKCWQAVPRYRKSLHLVSEEGKSLSSSRVSHKDMLESVNQGMAKKRRALVGSEEFRHRTIKLSTSKCESNHRNKKSLQNIPDKGHKDCSDIEEGQIVMEEPCLEASTSRRDVSEVAALTETARKGRSKNENNAVHLIGGYDSQRILDTLAKMEKRRERFKQPISTKAEESSVINNDSAVDTGEMKQHRPARKRSWLGS
ncbi:FIP1[III]-like protein [Arachis duranensis]|uniref:FIP1[III]-like protein n=1 Tax=Arachis duranensis TaxID=130453 RepID=A0A6P4D1B5_ARADU|nr:FIP1[III]-like protein [Arachis duranensis]